MRAGMWGLLMKPLIGELGFSLTLTRVNQTLTFVGKRVKKILPDAISFPCSLDTYVSPWNINY